jgi:hypothetical protein
MRYNNVYIHILYVSMEIYTYIYIFEYKLTSINEIKKYLSSPPVIEDFLSGELSTLLTPPLSLSVLFLRPLPTNLEKPSYIQIDIYIRACMNKYKSLYTSIYIYIF